MFSRKYIIQDYISKKFRFTSRVSPEGNSILNNSELLEGIEPYQEVFQSKLNFKTPFIWLGHIFNGRPIPWLEFPVEGIILNAFEIFQKKSIFRLIKSGKSLRDILPKTGSTKISLDSGGFLFQKSPDIKLPMEDFLSILKFAQPDFVYALDHPLNPSLKSSDNLIRIKRTLKNLQQMEKKLDNISVVPVLHGYTPSQIRFCASALKKYIGNDPPMIACGSLVPLMRTSGQILPGYLKQWETTSRRVMVIRILKQVRSLFPSSKLHVFGIGGTNIMHLMYLVADSVDSIGWRWSAAGGMIRILGIGERYISGRKESVRWNPNLSQSDWDKIKKCQCPICKKEQNLLKISFEARAIHNAFVYQEETRLARELIQKGTYLDYLFDRLVKNSALKNLLNEFRNS